MDRYICIHGHFYQPPRENPWLESVEYQESAHPYHDWNERITAECYAPNSTSRILDGEGRIVQLVNNYSKISFNFGPTLLAWMERTNPNVYHAVLDADEESRNRFSGHGSAIAQAYNHMIMPLANARDKRTQICWGIEDFKHRFGRLPEGMWLPEAAVDLESLDIMAEFGIQFTILAPRQAQSVRPLHGGDWYNVSGGIIDPTQAYKISLPSGRSLALFFYDGPISQALAFEGLLLNGEDFARRLIDAFHDDRTWPQIVHIATDGESYGHHHKNGDMALAYALNYIESKGLARLTNYGEYLELHPPANEVRIYENSSWSCVHGVERWRSDCGCNSGGYPHWNQSWRGPLRAALDWLRDTLEPAFEDATSVYLRDPWKARDDYIALVLERSRENIDAFLKKHALKELEEQDRIRCLKLLECQRHAMLMYTSCGWFFDELSGIETVQVIHYAGRTVQLARQIFGEAVEPRFLKLLQEAKSNMPEHRDGRTIYEKWVRPAMVDLTRVAAHFAVGSVFEENLERTIGAYSVEHEDLVRFQTGRNKLLMGRSVFTSQITTEESQLTYGVLHFGDHNIRCGVRHYLSPEAYSSLVEEVSQAFQMADFPETILLLDKHFGDSTYSLLSLFRDEQLKVLDMIIAPALDEAEIAYGQLFEHNAPLLRFLVSTDVPVARPLYWATEFVLNSRLKRALSLPDLDEQHIESLLENANFSGITLHNATLEFAVRKNLEALADNLIQGPDGVEALEKLAKAADILPVLPFEVNLRQVQNAFYAFMFATLDESGTNGKLSDVTVEYADVLKHLAWRLGISYPAID
jgi:alpha-amylase/alpha-mannosidase (GH57 family)